jgi:DNA-binding GntR family transcriptional regulator
MMVDEIAEVLRERILEGRLAAPKSLTQRQLADDLNVSRAVAGEALRMLHGEGLVSGVAGAMHVAVLNDAALLSAYAVRELLDGLGAHLAAQRAGVSIAKRCRAAIDAQASAVSSGDRLRQTRADISFHASLIEGSSNRTLRRHWSLVRFTFRTSMSLTPTAMQRAIADHEAILAAVVRGEPEQAERVARAHVRTAMDALRTLEPFDGQDRQARSP